MATDARVSHPDLGSEELAALVRRVFAPRPTDRAMGLLSDLPDGESLDTSAWRERREMALGWRDALACAPSLVGLEVRLWHYPNVHRANADLPASAWLHEGGPLPGGVAALDPALAVPFEEVLTAHDLLLAPTEHSATAPLKLLAKKHGFRAATMPGFTRAMVPALRLDYDEVARRVSAMKRLLDENERAELLLVVDGAREHRLALDLRHREAHASTGLLREPGTVGNLPSGEAYIVPYEGEIAGDPSRSAGELPVELDGEVVIYEVSGNRAVRARGEGSRAAEEAARLAREPAYGNLAELGLGVLADFGVEPIGELLLDEKLGLHIAFGRSDHFGGAVGARDFTSPEAVVHIDRVYLESLQPRVRAARVDLLGPGGRLALIRDGRYVYRAATGS
jgi:hypothetical protein